MTSTSSTPDPGPSSASRPSSSSRSPGSPGSSASRRGSRRRAAQRRLGAPDPSAPYVARTPTDLVVMAPLVLGFHPEDSVVLLTFGSTSRSFHARVDLPTDHAGQRQVVGTLLAPARAHHVVRVAVLLHTDDVEAARSQGRLLVEAFLEAGIEVIDVLRVCDGRWHALEDDGPGTAYDASVHPFTTRRVVDGHRVRRDRAELEASLHGADDQDRTDVALAATRFLDLLGDTASGPVRGPRRDRVAVLRALDDFLCTEARWLQQRVRDAAAGRERLAPADAGRLLVLASLVPTRDVAWAEIRRESASAHVDLWLDLVRRAPHELLPGACSLLAFAAWQAGDGALAWCALDRCREADPDYSMARCVADLLTGAVDPGGWEGIEESELRVFDPERGRSGSPRRG